MIDLVNKTAGSPSDGVPQAVATRLPALLDWAHDSYQKHFGLLGVVVAELGDQGAVESAASALLASDEEAVRALGFDLIAAAAIGYDQGDYIPWLLGAAAVPAAHGGADLRWSVAHALGASDDERSLDLLIGYANDADADVRWQVAAGVPNGLDPWPQALITVMLQLMQDDSYEVRDWATFGLGVNCGADTPAIRDALAQRLDDPGGETAGEACVGLAKRKDPRALPVILDRLADPEVGNLYVEAAAELANPAALPGLEHLRDGGWADDDPRSGLLDEAITACQSDPRTVPRHQNALRP